MHEERSNLVFKVGTESIIYFRFNMWLSKILLLKYKNLVHIGFDLTFYLHIFVLLLKQDVYHKIPSEVKFNVIELGLMVADMCWLYIFFAFNKLLDKMTII